ncbi:MAG: hypothetical protein NTZ73_01795 [Candidatus Diapherotrites archaeon]|nr:hypothetical protein [Candidatus Diapherotrites archaeon]
MQIDINGQYYLGGAVTISGTVAPAAANDLNIYLTNASSGAVFDSNTVAADANGAYSITYNYLSAGDYNGLVTDANSSATNRFYLKITNYASIDINFVGSMPPLNIGQALVANFTLRDYNNAVVTSDYNIALKLVDSDGTVVKDQNNYVPKSGGANRTDDYNFGALPTPGTYTIIVDNGVTGFNVPVIAYNLFVNSFNSSTGDPQKIFAAGQDANVKVFMSNTSGTPITSGTISGTIQAPSSVTQSPLTFTPYGGYFMANTGALSTQGEYTIRVSASALGYSQNQELKLKIQSYSMLLQPKKNESAGKKERMKGAYSTSSQAILELSITDLNTNMALAGLDLNSACNKNKLSLTVYKAGSTVGTSVTFDVNNVPDKTCDLNFVTPSSTGEYRYKLVGTDMNVANTVQDLATSTGLKVQNQMVFFDAVDPSAYAQDSSNSWKFTFYKDENIGFVANVIDLNVSDDADVSAVSKATIMQNGQRITITNTVDKNYLDYNAESHVLLMLGSALTDNNVSAGFVPIEFTVDVNSNNDAMDANSITAFGAFKYKIMNISSMPADENGGSKSTMFGPPVFHSDTEGVYLQVSVTNAGGTAIKYANVELYSLRNVDDWNELSVAPINAISDNNNLITSSAGTAHLHLGTLSSGIYFGQVKVTNGSTIDYGDFFLMVKSYIVNAQPLTVENGQCMFMNSIGQNSDFNMVIMAMNPALGMPVNDYVPDENGTKVFLMSMGEEFKEPTIYDVTLSSPFDFNCTGMMGPPGEVQTFKAMTVHPNGDSNWQAGNYRVLVKGSSAELGAEAGDGFFRVQPFKFSLMPLAMTGMGGGDQKMLNATPGSAFDFNVISDKSITLRAILVDEKTQQDVNSNINFVNNSNTVNANELTTVSVLIPSNIPLSEYPLIVFGDDTSGNQAEQDLFLRMSLFNLVVPSGIGNQNLQYQQSNTGAYDTNILDDATNGNLRHSSGPGDSGHYCDGNVTVGDINYNRWIMAGTDWARNDLNHLMLVNTIDQNVWIDYDNDCNFVLDDADSNRHVGDTNIGSMTDGNAMLVTDITSMALTYMKKPFDFNNSSRMQGTFIGQYPVDENIGVPIIIKNLDGTTTADINVTINRAMLLPSFGMGMPQETTGWTAWQGTTDADGFARAILNVSRPGTYMLEIKATNTAGTSQIFKPWEGMVVEAKKYKTEMFLQNQIGDITIDFNNVLAGSGVFIEDDESSGPGDNGDGLDQTWYDANYGLFDESARDFDLDKDGAKDKNFYFIKLNDAFHTANSGMDANILVDDDTNFCNILYRGPDNNRDDCDQNVLGEVGLNEGWFDNTSGLFLCPYSNAQGSMQNTSCGNNEAVYAISENDTNVNDNDAIIINRTTWRALDNTGNNWGLWMIKDGINNAAGSSTNTWTIFKDLQGVKLNSSGTMSAKLFRTSARPQMNQQNTMIPMPGTYPGTITGGIGKINYGNLPDSNYSMAVDVNINNDLQTQYENFEIRSS